MADFLSIQPSELKFPFELKRQSSCSLQLTNKTNQYIAFKVKTTNPKRYCVRPNAGIVLPNSVCSIKVTMQAHKEVPPDMQCRDKFLIQSVIAPYGATNKDVTQEMFNRGEGKVTSEFKLRVVYIPANPPSPVPEGDEDGASSTASSADDEIRKLSFSEAAWSVAATLKEEKEAAAKKNRELLEELELTRKQTRRGPGGASIGILLLFLLLGILVGYFLRK